jgi:GST-like protein
VSPEDLQKDLEYADNRILNDHLAKSRYMVGDTYTIVDMASWGWARMVPFVLGDEALEKFRVRPKDKFTFKAEMDDEARNIMFRHLGA